MDYLVTQAVVIYAAALTAITVPLVGRRLLDLL